MNSSILLCDIDGLNMGLRRAESQTKAQEACHSVVTSVLPGDLPALLPKPKALHREHKEKVKVISGWTNNSKMYVLQATECSIISLGAEHRTIMVFLLKIQHHGCIAPAIIHIEKKKQKNNTVWGFLLNSRPVSWDTLSYMSRQLAYKAILRQARYFLWGGKG